MCESPLSVAIVSCIFHNMKHRILNSEVNLTVLLVLELILRVTQVPVCAFGIHRLKTPHPQRLEARTFGASSRTSRQASYGERRGRWRSVAASRSG